MPTIQSYWANVIPREVPIHLFKFQNAVVFGQGSVIVGNNHLVLDSAAEFINHNLAPDGMIRDGGQLNLLPTDRRRLLPGTSILVKRPWYRNFGHWLAVDLMPILPLLSDAAVDIDRIIFGGVPDGTLKTIMKHTAHTFYPEAEVVFADDVEQGISLQATPLRRARPCAAAFQTPLGDTENDRGRKEDVSGRRRQATQKKDLR